MTKAELRTVERVLTAWKVRLAFVGHPKEPKDWSKPVRLSDALLLKYGGK